MITEDPTAGTAGPWFWCRVCGAPACTWIREAPAAARCWKHVRSNGCAIEGCTRSTATREGERPMIHFWLCGTHWRIACPPRSLRRRAYHAFFRRAKRHGWSDELRTKFWSFWLAMVGSANKRRVDGHIDFAEIERLFGP